MASKVGEFQKRKSRRIPKHAVKVVELGEMARRRNVSRWDLTQRCGEETG